MYIPIIRCLQYATMTCLNKPANRSQRFNFLIPSHHLKYVPIVVVEDRLRISLKSRHAIRLAFVNQSPLTSPGVPPI